MRCTLEWHDARPKRTFLLAEGNQPNDPFLWRTNISAISQHKILDLHRRLGLPLPPEDELDDTFFYGEEKVINK